MIFEDPAIEGLHDGDYNVHCYFMKMKLMISDVFS